MWKKIGVIGQRLGVLRGLLSALALLLIITTPFADLNLPPYGWGLLRGVILPAAGPLVVMVLLLDVLMAMVLKGEFTGNARARLVFVAKWHLILATLLLLVWLPVFLRATYL